jgi:hypothetical protein
MRAKSIPDKDPDPKHYFAKFNKDVAVQGASERENGGQEGGRNRRQEAVQAHRGQRQGGHGLQEQHLRPLKEQGYHVNFLKINHSSANPLVLYVVHIVPYVIKASLLSVN